MRIVKILLVLSVLLASCSVQKRHYMKGLYFESLVSKKHEKQEGSTIKSFYKTNNTDGKEKKKDLVASAKPAETLPENELKQPEAAKPVIVFENCDTLFFRDGTVIAAKIIELNATEIKYRYCSGGETEVIRAVLKSSVEQVIYSNGLKEAFKKPEPVVQNQSYTPKKNIAGKLSVAALLGFILALLFYPALLITFFAFVTAAYGGTLTAFEFYYFLIPVGIWIGGLVFSIIGITQTTKKENRRRGLGFAIAGLIILLVPALILLFSVLRI